MREREKRTKELESFTKESLLSPCVCVGTFQLSSSYKKSLVLSMPYIIFITPKVTAIRVQIYSHQLELIELIYQCIKFKEYITNSSFWKVGCPFVSSNLMWSEWDVTVSNSVQAPVLNPLSIHARHSKNLWIVTVYEKPPSCLCQWTKLSVGNTWQAKARTFSGAVFFTKNTHVCVSLV